MKVYFTGGGSGGHIFPIIAIAREIKRTHPKIKLYYMGPKDPFSSIFFAQENIKTRFVLSGKIRRYFNFVSFIENIFDVLFKIPFGIFQSFIVLFFSAPDMIFSKGGHGSLPVVIAGWMLRIPIFIHESDITPGMANKIASRMAVEIFVAFPPKETEYFSLKKMTSVGNPVRSELMEGDFNKAKEIFNLKYEKPTILILGGSQGSQIINENVLQMLTEMLKDFEVIHQCGDDNFKQVKKEFDTLVPKELHHQYHLYGFLKEEHLKHAYAAADFVISRSGSGNIFELAALSKPSILIPLANSAQNHQVKNAYCYAKFGACIVLEENNLTPNFFFEKIKNLFIYKDIDRMAQKAKEFSRPNAAKVIANYLIGFLTW